MLLKEEALYQFLEQTIKYPQLAKEQGIQGAVHVSFVVEADGSISDVLVAKGVEESLDAESVRAVQLMPDWKPGEFQGNPVSVKMNLPVRFKL